MAVAAVAIAAAAAAAGAPTGADAACPSVVNVTSDYTRTELDVGTAGALAEVPTQNVVFSASATPLNVTGGTEVSLTVRVDPPCGAAGELASRTALAASLFLTRRDGSVRRVPTDRSWGWRGGAHSVLSAAVLYAADWEEEWMPPGASWVTHLPRTATSTFWTSIVKTLLADICDGVHPLNAAAPPPGASGVGGGEGGYREWAHSIARSMYPKRFSVVSIGDLFGKGSLYCGGGDLLTTVRVNASVPRTGVGQHNLQTLLSWEGTDKEVNLENRVWLLTEKTYGVDALAFFRCVKCDHMPELESKLIAVGIQNKFKNLVGDAEKQKQNLFSADVVYKSWSLLPNGQSFGRYWSDWKERFVYWGVAYLDAQVKFDMNKKADTNRMCADNSIVTTKEQLAFALDSTTFHNTMVPGALLKCVVQHF